MANFQGFGAAMAETASHVATPPKFIYNIAARNNYASLWYLLNGRKMSDMLKAGSDVRARVKFTASSKAGWYNVTTDDHSPQISQDGTWAIAYWCAHMAQESWKEEELLVNSGGTTEGSIAEETWTQELWNKFQSLMTQFHASMSDATWALPSIADMDGNDPIRPYSIPTYVNEYTNGLFKNSAGTSFTNIHTLLPGSTHPAYKPYQKTYANFTTGDAASFIYAMSLAMRKTQLIPPPMSKEYFDPESDTDVEKSGGVIFCSSSGVSKAENMYRASQDRWMDWMDPAGNPRFKNVQLVYDAALDSYAGYPDGSGNGIATETTANVTGPRFYGINAKYMKMYFHKNRFMKFLDPFRENLTTWTQGVNTLGTMLCPDRSKHFILYPSSSIAMP